MKKLPSKLRPQRHTAGYTLLELVVASASAAVLMGGLSSSLYIASQSLNVSTGTLAEIRTANQALAIINRDLQSALTLSELTATSVTMTVPDRDGNSVPETIRYVWGGAAGTPLSQDYNGTTTVLANDVQSFSLKWVTRLIEGVSSAPIVLLVVVDDASLSTAESDRKALIESWGYSVTPISASASQANFDTAVAESTVVYIPETISSSDVGTKLTSAAIGVVNEEAELIDKLGIATDKVWQNRQEIDVVNNSHYITSEFLTGLLTFSSSNQSVPMLSGTMAPDLASLGKTFNTGSQWEPSLAILDAGDQIVGGGTAAGRRANLPWGGGGFDINLLTDDGQTIMQRALEWGAGAGDDTETPETGVTYQEFTEKKEASNTTSITIDLPPGTATGDLLIAAVATDGEKDGILPAPAGWNEVVVEESSGAVTLGVWWKLAGSSEPSNYTFTWSDTEKAYGWIMRFTGHDSANPINAWDDWTNSSNLARAKEVTTTVADTLILRLGGFDEDDVTIDDAGMTDHTTITMDESSASTTSASGGAAYEMQATAGLSTSADFTLTASEQYVTVTIAIAPDPSP